MVEKLINMKLEDVYNQFPNREDCIKHIEYLRWDNKPVCPYCNSTHYTELQEKYRYHCNTCNISFSVTVNTLFHKTKIDLQKWFYAIHLIINNEQKISARDLSKKINTTKDTAWRLINEIKISLIKQDKIIEKILKDEGRKNT